MKRNFLMTTAWPSAALIGAGLLLAACGNESADEERAAPEPPAMEESQDSDDGGSAMGDDAMSGETEGDSELAGERPAGWSGNGSSSMGFTEPVGEMALSDGSWRAKDGDALFGEAETEASLTLSCDSEAGEIVMYRSIALGENEQVRLGIYTEAGNAAGYWRGAGTELPQAEARLAADDAIFGKISDADRFGVAAEGNPALVVPVNDTVRGVIEDCGE